MPLIPREVIRQNMEYRCEERIGLNFDRDRRDDFAWTGADHGFKPKVWVEGNFEYSTDLWGNVWHRIIGLSQGGEIFKPVLESWDRLDELKLPDLASPACYQGARDLGVSATDKFKVGWMVGWPFAICRYMRKMEVYLMDLIECRDRIDVLHDRVTTLLERAIDRFGEAGLDGIMFCEDLGVQDRTLMSPAMWREIFRPLYERLTARAHRHGLKVIQHSCGYNWALVDDRAKPASTVCSSINPPCMTSRPWRPSCGNTRLVCSHPAISRRFCPRVTAG